MASRHMLAAKLSRVLAAMILFALAACAPAPGIDLNNTSWRLAAIDGQAIPADVQATIQFKDGNIGGNAGCNSYGGKYRLEGDRLAFPEPIYATLMACVGEGMAIESTFLAALGAGATVTTQNGKLILTGDNGTVLTFTAQ